MHDCKGTDSSNKRIVITNRFGAVRRQMELDGFGCAALPTNMQSQPLWFRALDDGDIPDQQAEHALAVMRCGGWSGPKSREVSGQLQDLPFLFGRDGTQCLPLEVRQLGLQFEPPLHRVVPTLLERAGDQPVGGVDRFIAPFRQVDVVAGPLDPPPPLRSGCFIALFQAGQRL